VALEEKGMRHAVDVNGQERGSGLGVQEGDAVVDLHQRAGGGQAAFGKEANRLLMNWGIDMVKNQQMPLQP